MAQAPMCKVCGTAHWSGQPHAFAKPLPVPKATGQDKPKPLVVTKPPAEPQPVIASVAEYIAAERAKKAAYMREYRAKVKV